MPTRGPFSPSISSLAEGALLLDVRSAVAVRQVSARQQTLFYLSVFDDEIDGRLEEFLAFGSQSTWDEPGLATAALWLEPTDAVVVASADGDVLVARGGAANFPLYWRPTAGRLRVSTMLPIDDDRVLSRTGLTALLAAASITSQHEPNLVSLTPLHGWFRARRGAVSRLSASAGCISERHVDLAECADTDLDRDQLVDAARSALSSFGRRQHDRSKAVVELSGGFDSTLAAIAARARGIELVGISVHFPYYEFRFEEEIQRAVAASLAVSRLRLDGSTLFPFAPSDWWPRLDEPAISVIGLKHALTIARLASTEGVDRVFVGHGGDDLFAEDLLGHAAIRSRPARGALSRRAWSEVHRLLAVARSSSSIVMRSSLTFSYEARLDVTFKEAFGTTTRSPFTDLAWVRCGLSWARLSTRVGHRSDKSILADAFAAELPPAARDRRGKVPWDGICARAYAQHGDSILEEIERVRDPLKHVGLNLGWLGKRIAQLASGQKTTKAQDDREVIAAYALATWLRSWGVEQMADCGWRD